jgi:hypothetical protein
MHNILPESFEQQAENTQRWLQFSAESVTRKAQAQHLLSQKARVEFGQGCFLAADACLFAQALLRRDRRWVASAGIVRGDVHIDADRSINPDTHFAGLKSVGGGCKEYQVTASNPASTAADRRQRSADGLREAVSAN